MIVIVPPKVAVWVYIYLCGRHMHCSRVAAMQYHCCVVEWQCRARALTLPRTRLDPPVGHQSIHAHRQYTTNSQGDSHAALEFQSNGGTGLMAGAQSAVGIQGPETVHEASRAIRLTHWLSCTSPRCSWRVQVHLHAAIHRFLVRIQSISLGTWCLHAKSYA